MHLTPKEIDKLMLLSLGMVAERRMKKGLKLNYPEAVAYITSTALEGAREGKTVEEIGKQLGMKPEEVFRLSGFTRDEFLELMTKDHPVYSKARVIRSV